MIKRRLRDTAPVVLAALPHLFPALLCVLLLLAAGLSAANAQDAPEVADACPQGRSAVPELSASEKWPALESQAAAVPNGEGRLFRLERDGIAPSWLFGTMHLSDPRILALSPGAEAALTQARAVVIETTDILDAKAMGGTLLARPDLTTLPAGQTLETLLSPADLARIKPALEARGMPLAAIRTLQPWFVAAGMMLPACEVSRAAGGAKVLDVALAARAAEAGKPVAGLETATEQLEALAAMPLALQADNLVASLDLEDQLPDIFETMIDLYLGGRIALIEPATAALMPAGTDEATSLDVTQAFEERVVHRRNAVMAERLLPRLTEGGQFAAVGALHLPGDTGLVESLRRAGWRVTRAD